MITIQDRSEADTVLKEASRKKYLNENYGSTVDGAMIGALRSKATEIREWADEVRGRNGPGDMVYKDAAALAQHQAVKAEVLANEVERMQNNGIPNVMSALYKSDPFYKRFEQKETDNGLLRFFPPHTYEGNGGVVGRDIMMRIDRNFQELQDRVVEHETGVDPRSVPGETVAPDPKPEKRKLFGLSLGI